ncbi:MAG TPA: HAMP domain-containing sensor histidine kinase [Methylocella sp.]
MKSFSLSSRLVGYLLVGQLIVYVIIWILNIPLSLTGIRVDLDMIRNDLAENSVRAQVAASLRRTADGVPYIEPTEALREKAAQNPHLKYAVFDLTQTMAFQGSSPELVGQLRKMGEIKAFLMNFTFEGAPDSDLRGALTKVDTSAGRVIIVTYGYQFHWDDLIYFFRDNAWDNFIYFVPVAAAAAAIAWVAATRGLSPLRDAAAHASRIDMNSIDQRIPLEGIPAETMPLVEAVNAALARLDAGAARQRRFAANAAHELRTPVAILRTRIDALSDVPYKTNLKRDVRRIQTIVDQLLIAARLNEHGGTMDGIVDLVTTIRTVVADYAPLVVENKKHIEFESPVPSVRVRGNRQALECIAANLIDNALRAEPEGKSVLVRVGPGGTVDVVDHGAGIPKDSRDRIFEPFWRGSETSPGTGLGLAIVKELLDLHKGRVSVVETPGGGATFRVTLTPA